LLVASDGEKIIANEDGQRQGKKCLKGRRPSEQRFMIGVEKRTRKNPKMAFGQTRNGAELEGEKGYRLKIPELPRWGAITFKKKTGGFPNRKRRVGKNPTGEKFGGRTPNQEKGKEPAVLFQKKKKRGQHFWLGGKFEGKGRRTS